MENPVKMDDLGKTHYFRKHPYFASPFFLEGKQKPEAQKAQSAMGSQWPPATLPGLVQMLQVSRRGRF